MSAIFRAEANYNVTRRQKLSKSARAAAAFVSFPFRGRIHHPRPLADFPEVPFFKSRTSIDMPSNVYDNF